jgi:2-polyprenyl-3-methyl-5-hydroxy-6-metoxy-1,4-benzoquinol methylase
VDSKKLDEFMGRFALGFGAIVHGPSILIGEELGLYKALAASDGMSAKELAKATGTHERMVREWLCAQAASEYVESTGDPPRFSMSPEQAMALADETSRAYIPGALLLASTLYKDWPRVSQAYRSGKGLGWNEHSPEMFVGTERFFRASYVGNLISSWLPALDGVVAKLEKGCRVADVGCGHGASTILMAIAFPKSRFHGFDYHAPSIDAAKEAAAKAGVGDQAEFAVASADGYDGRNYELVACFDCLHDMGDPAAVARHIRGSLARDGSWMIVEPFANETLAANLTPVGRIFYSASSQICVPASIAQKGQMALGAQAGDAVFEGIARKAGFTRFRRATETPFNRVFEARP